MMDQCLPLNVIDGCMRASKVREFSREGSAGPQGKTGIIELHFWMNTIVCE